MANPYPNVSVALDMNAKVSGSFKNAKSRYKKDFYDKISDFFKKPTVAGFFRVGLLGRVFFAKPV